MKLTEMITAPKKAETMSYIAIGISVFALLMVLATISHGVCRHAH